ncbi:hypothetical protein BG003_010428 [Podila horticola]|nr:hypothetical protein BG003_010428 [Podila horticola]
MATSHHPLLMPEILAIITNTCFPEWHTHISLLGDQHTITPPESLNDLLACLQVCKTWNAVFSPVLYHTYTYTNKQTIDAPSHATIAKYAHLVRAFVCNYKDLGRDDIVLPCHDVQFPNLDQLVLLDRTEITRSLEDIVSTHIPKCTRLHRFQWRRTAYLKQEMPEPAIQTLLTFDHLQELGLFGWTLLDDRFPQILANIHNTLTTLTVSRLHGFNVLPQDLILPSLKVLNLHFAWAESEALVKLPKVCPVLEEIHLIVDTLFDGDVLAESLAHHCPALKTLTYREEYSMAFEQGCFIEDIEYSALVASPQHLEFVQLGLPGLSETMTDALVLHADSLVHLYLRMCRGLVLDADRVLKILTTCTQLKHVELQEVDGSAKSFIEPLTAEPWVCTGLKTLVINGYIPVDVLPLPKLKARRGKAATDKNDEEAIATIRFSPFFFVDQGWYLDPNDSMRKAEYDWDIKRKLMMHLAPIPLERLELEEIEFYREEIIKDSDSEDWEEEEEEVKSTGDESTQED